MRRRGIIAGVQRTLEADETEYMIADVPTNPGHTGGVLFNNRGEMIGMLTDIRAKLGNILITLENRPAPEDEVTA